VATTSSGIRLRSRNGRDLTDGYPMLAELELPPGLMLGAEIVALDARGRSDFELLQQRLHNSSPSPALVEAVPVSMVVFDVLRVDDMPQLTTRPDTGEKCSASSVSPCRAGSRRQRISPTSQRARSWPP
jgi:ATP-dependent DNA ligase